MGWIARLFSTSSCTAPQKIESELEQLENEESQYHVSEKRCRHIGGFSDTPPSTSFFLPADVCKWFHLFMKYVLVGCGWLIGSWLYDLVGCLLASLHRCIVVGGCFVALLVG